LMMRIKTMNHPGSLGSFSGIRQITRGIEGVREAALKMLRINLDRKA